MALTIAQIQNAYVAFFNRPADVAGLNYWSNYAGNSADLLNTFAESAEYKGLYAGLNNTQLVNAIYQNLFGRTPDVAGLNYWVTQLDNGTLKVGNIADAVNKGAQGTDKTIIENKTAAATAFTSALDTTAEIVAYAGVNSTGLQAVKTWLNTLNDATKTVASVTGAELTSVLNTVQNNVATVGQTFTLTASADDFSPNSQAANSKTTAGNDTFLAGSVQGGGAHTLGAADNIDGAAGTDTIKIVEDRAAAPGNTLFPRMANVENVEVQALTAAAVDFTNTTGVQRLVSDRSNAAVTVTNLRDDATLVLSNTNTRLSVDYAANATLDTIARIELANAGAAAGVDFATPGAQENAITTLNLKVDGTPTTLSTASITGLNGTGALVNVVLSGNANTTFTGNMAADDLDPNTAGNQPALFKDVTSINATALTGTLTLSMLGDQANVADRNITFQGGSGNTTLTIGQGNNNVTFGAGNDLLILSSTGLNAQDTLNGGAGTDQLEIHFNDTNSAQAGAAAGGVTPNGLDDATDAVVVAVNAAQNFETLVVDVWNQGGAANNVNPAANNAESVNLKADLFNITNFAFQDTFQDGNNAGNGIVDADISGSITVTGVRNANTFTLRSDVTNVADFTAATGNNTLSLTVVGADATNSANTAVNAPVTVASAGTSNLADDDSVALLRAVGLSNVNITLTNVDNTTTTAVNEAGTATLTEVRVDDGATVRLTGNVLAASATINSRDVQEALTGNTAAFGATLDASGLTTIADRDAATVAAGAAPGVNRANVLAVNQGLNVTIIGTAQDDNITGSNGNDVLTGGAGDDIINTLDGNDTVTAGDGVDVVNAGSGVKNISTGAGNDRVVFASTVGDNLTSADIVDGGDGRDTVAVSGAGSVLADAIYNQITNVEIIELSNNSSATLNAIANARSFDTVAAATGASITVNVQEGFSRNLTVNLSNGNDTVNATTAPGAVTVNANAANINGNDSIIGGTSANDVLALTADNGVAYLNGLRNVETVRLVSDANTGTAGNLAGVEDITVVVGSDAAIAAPAANQTRTLTIDGSALASRVGNAATDRPDAIIDGSAIVGAGKLLNITTAAGFDAVYGGVNADTINTGAGDDTIFGGNGADVLTGGAGSDRFTYSAVANSSAAAVDTITDFVGGTTNNVANDRIVIDNALLGGKALRFAGNQANFGAAQGATIQNDNQVDYVFQADTNTLWVDINDDGTLNANDLQIKLNGLTSITSGDVIAGSVAANSGLTAAIGAFTVNGADLTAAGQIQRNGVNAGNTFAALETAGRGVNDTLAVSGNSNISTAGLPTTAFQSVTFAGGSNTTMTAAQHTGLVTGAVLTGTQTVILTDALNGNAIAGVENYTLANVGGNNIAVLAATNVNASAASADTISVAALTVTGTYQTGTEDNLSATAGANISGATIGNVDELNVNSSAGTFTMTQAQHEQLTTVANTNNVQTFALTSAGILTARAGIENYTLANAANNNITVQTGTNVNASAVSADTITVGGLTVTGTYQTGTEDILSATAGANISGATIGSVDELNVNNSAGTFTMSQAQHQQLATLTNTGNSQMFNVNTVGTVTGRADIEAYQVVAGSTFILQNGAQAVSETGAAAVTTVDLNGQTVTANITMGGGDNLRVTQSASIAGAVAGGYATVDFNNTNNVTFTVLAGQNNGLTFNNTTNTQTIQVNRDQASTDEAVTAKAGIETYNLAGAGGYTITVGSTTAAVNINGSDGIDVVKIDGSTVTGNYSLGNGADEILATSGANIAGVNTGNVTTAETLNLTGGITMTTAQHNGFTTITAGGTADSITLTTAATNFNADAVIETYNLANAANTFTFNANPVNAQSVNGGTAADVITAVLDSDATANAIYTASVGMDTAADRVNIKNASLATLDNGGYVVVNNFAVAQDQVSSQVNGAAQLGGFQTINTANTNLTVGANSVIEINSAVSQFIGAASNATAFTDAAKTLIAGAVGTAADGNYSAVLYSGNTAALFQFATNANGADVTTGNITAIELVGVFNNVGADAFTGVNFA